MFVFKAAVVGAGTMGGEIAQTIAAAEVPVILKDVEPAFVEAGLDRARAVWQGQVDAGRLDPAELERKLALISGTTSYDGFGDVDFVIEAVPERMTVKQAVFTELDEVTPGHAILASNTSALSITEMGEATSRPEKIVGFHFFYPASVIRLIEVVEGEDTAAETAQAAVNFAQAIRKLPIRCGEAPGFVVNRILNSAVSELWRAQEETGMEVDSEYLREALGERVYGHSALRELVDSARLGTKTGRSRHEHGR
jgi:3-hydroxyacyl-CoA dehydrogenase